MAKLVELKEAAEQLGLTPEALTELVDQKKIFGYRDGASWKFKPTEIERVASELGLGTLGDAAEAKEAAESISLSGSDDMIDVDELQLDDDSSDDADSILISEEELGRSDDSTSSTIIGKAGLDSSSADSDINISEEEVIAMPSDEDSDLSLAADDDSDLALAGDSDLSLADSDLDLQSESPSASNVLAGDSDLLSIDGDEAGNGGVVSAGSGIDLSLDDASSGSAGSSVALDDDIKLDADSGVESGIGADSSIDLDLDDDDDLLAGSGMGSDITLGASDSGINLSNPSDSGISLEDVGSGIDSSLELGDDDMIELEADAEESSDLQGDEDFMLTPVAGDGDLDEESDDSGSQVIALDSDEFDESSAGPLVADDDPLASDGDALSLDDVGAATAGGAAAASAGAVAVAGAAEEADFSVWNIVSLSMLTAFMAICALLALDVIRNIWTWNQPFGVSDSLMNFFTGM